MTTSVMKFVSPDFQSSSSVRYLSSEDARRILEASENVRIAVSVLYDTVERTKSQAMAYLQTRYFTVDDLAITGIEIDRFEREHKLQEARYLPRRFFTWLSETNNQRTLGILSAGVAGLSAAVWAIYRHFFG